VHKVVVGVAGASTGYLVWVMQRGEAAEARLDFALGRVQRHAQVRVEGTLALQVIVGLIDGVEQVQCDYGDVDAPAVFGEARRARLRLGVARADGDAIVERLCPARY